MPYISSEFFSLSPKLLPQLKASRPMLKLFHLLLSIHVCLAAFLSGMIESSNLSCAQKHFLDECLFLNYSTVSTIIPTWWLGYNIPV